MNVQIGADPELFLQDSKGNFISSIGKFGGTKTNPRPVPNFADGFAVQEDNVAVEFNIPPTDDAKRFVRSIHDMVKYLEDYAAKLSLKLAIVPSAHFPKKELAHPMAKVFGCDPDFNVWMLRENPRPKAKDRALRSAGGHGHIAYTKDNIGLGRACDLFAGCPSILFDPDRQRRLLYGKAGAIREKSYGIEYRTLSNYWIRSPEYTEMVFHQFQQAVQFVDGGGNIPDEDARKIIKCINESDLEILRELSVKYRLIH